MIVNIQALHVIRPANFLLLQLWERFRLGSWSSSLFFNGRNEIALYWFLDDVDSDQNATYSFPPSIFVHSFFFCIILSNFHHSIFCFLCVKHFDFENLKINNTNLSNFHRSVFVDRVLSILTFENRKFGGDSNCGDDKVWLILTPTMMPG